MSCVEEKRLRIMPNEGAVPKWLREQSAKLRFSGSTPLGASIIPAVKMYYHLMKSDVGTSYLCRSSKKVDVLAVVFVGMNRLGMPLEVN